MRLSPRRRPPRQRAPGLRHRCLWGLGPTTPASGAGSNLKSLVGRRALSHFENRRCSLAQQVVLMDLAQRAALICLSTLMTLSVRAQTTEMGGPTPEAIQPVTLEQPATFEVRSTSGALKETVQTGQQLIWLGKGGPDDRRFEIGNISVAFLRNETAGELKMTFAGNASALGYRPIDEARLNVIVHTKAGASIYSWSISISIKCADYSQPLAPLVHEVPRDVAANVFNNVGMVEIAERREPNVRRVTVRSCV